MRRLKYLAAAAAIGSLITLAQTSSAGSLTEKGSTVSEGTDRLVDKAGDRARKGYGHKRWHRYHPHRRYYRQHYRYYYDDYPGYYPYFGYYPYGYYPYPRPYYGGPFIGGPFISFGFGVGG